MAPAGRLSNCTGASADGYITRSVNFRDQPPPRELQLIPHTSLPVGKFPAEPEARMRGDETDTPPKAAPRRRVWVPRSKRRADTLEVSEPAVLVEAPAPKIRIVDESEPKIRVIE